MTDEKLKTQPCVCCPGTMHLNYKTRDVIFGGVAKDVEVFGYWCDSCDEGIVEKEGSKAYDLAYAELKAEVQDVLGPASIKRIREKLGLSQRRAGELLGGGDRSFQKYESGGGAMSAGMSHFLDVLDHVPEASAYFFKKIEARKSAAGSVPPSREEKSSPDSHA